MKRLFTSVGLLALVATGCTGPTVTPSVAPSSPAATSESPAAPSSTEATTSPSAEPSPEPSAEPSPSPSVVATSESPAQGDAPVLASPLADVAAVVSPLGFECTEAKGDTTLVTCLYDKLPETNNQPVGRLDAMVDAKGHVAAALLRFTPNYDARTAAGRKKIEELPDVVEKARDAIGPSLLPPAEAKLFADATGLVETEWGQVGVAGSEWLAEDIMQKVTFRVFASRADAPANAELDPLWKMTAPSAASLEVADTVKKAVETSSSPAAILKAVTNKENSELADDWTVWVVPDIGEASWVPLEGKDNWQVTWTKPDVNVMAKIEAGVLTSLYMG